MSFDDGSQLHAVPLRGSGRSRCCLGRPDQIPTIACDVQKHCHPPIWLAAGRANELDAGRSHPAVGLLEVIHAQEETDTTSHLASDNGRLILSIGPSEKNPRLTSGWTHDDPSLWMSIAGQSWRILHQLKSQLLDEEIDRGVIALDNESDQV